MRFDSLAGQFLTQYTLIELLDKGGMDAVF